MISVTHDGNFSRMDKFFNDLLHVGKVADYHRYGKLGVDALKAATPKDTGLTADSWSYKVTEEKGRTTISWYNSNVAGEVSVAILLQYGHANQNGIWVEGVDYINPALKPVFDGIAADIWKEVHKA